MITLGQLAAIRDILAELCLRGPVAGYGRGELEELLDAVTAEVEGLAQRFDDWAVM